MPTTRQPLIFAIWPTIEPTEPAAAETTTVSPAFGLPTCEQAEIGGQAGDAIDAEQMRHRLHLRHLGEMLCRHRGIILPAGVAEHDIAGARPGAFDDTTSAMPPPAITVLASTAAR